MAHFDTRTRSEVSQNLHDINVLLQPSASFAIGCHPFNDNTCPTERMNIDCAQARQKLGKRDNFVFIDTCNRSLITTNALIDICLK